ncbi:MAG: PilZ domain-containing protein, partial [Gammaproteobacteria bacterium]|nr:PilZ domain-containing protein [Gammaproteobacteria bacterium]
MKDKREHQRIQLLRKVLVILPDGGEASLDVLDYSMGGMSIVSQIEFSVGEQLQLKSLVTLDGEEKTLDLIG